MKKAILLLVLLCLGLFQNSYGWNWDCCEWDWDVLAEAKVGVFHPTENKFRKIYGNGAIYGGEITVRAWDNWALWTSGSYYTQHGRSLGLHNSTKVSLIPVGFGLKYFIPCNWIDFYVGAGMDYFFLRTRDHTEFLKKHINKQGLGWIVKAGGIINFCNNFFVDCFLDYSGKRFHHRHNGIKTSAEVNGLSAGIGLGYRFNCF